MNRRGFLGGLLAAPAIVRAESLMKIWVPPKEVLVPQDPRRYLAKNRMFAVNYGIQGHVPDLRVWSEARYAARYRELCVNFPANALTIEYE